MPAVSSGMEGNLTWKLSSFSDRRTIELPNMTVTTRIPRLIVKMIPASQAAMFATIGTGDKISLPDKYLSPILDKCTDVLRTLDNRQDIAVEALDKKGA